MTEPAIVLLEKLLRLSEKNPDRPRAASVSPNYDQLQTAGAIERFEEHIAAAEKAGTIVVRRGRRERRHLIDRITVANPDALSRHLGRTPSRVTAASARTTLQPSVKGDPRIEAVLHDLIAKWERGEPAFRIAPNDLKPAQELLTLLAAIAAGMCRGLDARTFSLRTVGDSKGFDRHTSRLSTILADKFGYAGMDADQIWRQVGLERFSHPVHLSGPIVVADGAHTLIDGRVKPFASVHPELGPKVGLFRQPRILVTIENYASFNRYVREVHSDDMVVYTGGFPSAAVIDIVSAILRKADEEMRFFHWGDVDPGGVRIFRYLEQTLGRSPEPHLMTRQLAELKGRSAACDPGLTTIAESSSAVAQLAEWLARGENVFHLEQEALDPVRPKLT